MGMDWASRLVICRDKTFVKGHILVDDKPKVTGSYATPDWQQVVFVRRESPTLTP